MPAWLLSLLPELAKTVPGLVVQIIGLFHSTGGNPQAADFEALALKVANTPFDKPPGA